MNKTPSRAAGIAAALGKSVAYVICFMGCQMLTSLFSVVVAILSLMDPYGNLDMAAVERAVLSGVEEATLASGLLTLALVAIFYKLRRRSLRRELWLHRVDRRVYPAVIGLAMVLYWAVTLFFAMLPAQWLESYAEASALLEESGLMVFVSTVLVAPVVEEVIFRGLVLSRLNRVLPGWPALLISSAVFGILHGHPIWALYAAALGIAFGLVTMRTGSILPAIVMHLAFNCIGQLFTLFDSSEKAFAIFQLVFGVISAAAAFALRGHFARLMNGRGLSKSPYGRVARPATRPEPAPAPPRQQEAQWDSDSGPHHRFSVQDL